MSFTSQAASGLAAERGPPACIRVPQRASDINDRHLSLRGEVT
jgi:hypothetical protein